MTFDSIRSTVSGIWDDSDQLFTGVGGTKPPFDSSAFSTATSDLENENLYLQVHTLNFPKRRIARPNCAGARADPVGGIRGGHACSLAARKAFGDLCVMALTWPTC